jgi:hypothetical protein
MRNELEASEVLHLPREIITMRQTKNGDGNTKPNIRAF